MQMTLKQDIDGNYEEITTVDGSSVEEICENATEVSIDDAYVDEEELEKSEWEGKENGLFVIEAYTYDGDTKSFVLD